jgi:predicted Zn-dependent peptidase
MIKQHTLQNGFRIIVDEMKDVQSCTVSIGAGTGSFNETKEQNGISHFLEHMAFKGTEKRTAFEIANEVDCFGGSMNAFTSNDKTVYYIKSLNTHLEKSVDILADILLNSTFDEVELERERGVILQELAATLDTPDDVVFDYYKEQAFGDTPFGRTILGTEENIKSFQKKDLQHYVHSQYVPKNLVFSVAGNVDSQKVFDLAEKYFSKMKVRNVAQNVLEPKYSGGENIISKNSLTQVQFVMGFETIPFNHPHYYIASVASAVLGRGMSSRLFQEIREKMGLCYTIACFYEAYQFSGMFSIYSGTSPENLHKLEEALPHELARATQDISQFELAKVLEQYKSSILFANESTSSRSQKGISNLLSFGKYIESDEIISKVEAITIENVQSYLATLLQGVATKVVYGNV